MNTPPHLNGASAPVLRPARELRLHPQADLIPTMSSDERRAFLADVHTHGIQTPIDLTPEGVVLDGRERLQAAIAAGIELVPIRNVTATDQVEYMLRAALN